MPYFTVLGHVTLICNRGNSALTPVNLELESVPVVFKSILMLKTTIFVFFVASVSKKAISQILKKDKT